MRPFAVFITAATLTLHAVLGCCSHHAHAGEMACQATCDADHHCELHDTPEDGCAIGSQDHDSHAPDHSGEHCRGTVCQLLTNGKSSLTDADYEPICIGSVIDCAASICIAPSALHGRYAGDQPPAPSIPLYLLHQVLLT